MLCDLCVSVVKSHMIRYGAYGYRNGNEWHEYHLFNVYRSQF